jgi:hypothetical protein
MEQQPLIPEVLEGRADAPNSGNGRPRGARNVKQRVLERAVRSEVLPIIQKVCEQAKAGDTYAARLILDRVWPRPRMAATLIDLPETRTPGELRAAMHGLLARVTRGEIPPDEGAAIVAIMRDVLDSHRIQTFDVGPAVDVRAANARELLTERLARAIEERNRLAIAAAEEPQTQNGGE